MLRRIEKPNANSRIDRNEVWCFAARAGATRARVAVDANAMQPQPIGNVAARAPIVQLQTPTTKRRIAEGSPHSNAAEFRELSLRVRYASGHLSSLCAAGALSQGEGAGYSVSGERIGIIAP
jgi:hypothetical protein